MTSTSEPLTRLIICGDRDWGDWAAIVKDLNTLDRNTLLVVGMARGADMIAYDAAKALGFLNVIECRPNWEKFGRSAGVRRNQTMLDVILGGAEDHIRLVWAYHDDLKNSRGTKDMVIRASESGVKVKLKRHKGAR